MSLNPELVVMLSTFRRRLFSRETNTFSMERNAGSQTEGELISDSLGTKLISPLSHSCRVADVCLFHFTLSRALVIELI